MDHVRNQRSRVRRFEKKVFEKLKCRRCGKDFSYPAPAAVPDRLRFYRCPDYLKNTTSEERQRLEVKATRVLARRRKKSAKDMEADIHFFSLPESVEMRFLAKT
jgi:hypothetical protein